MEEFNITESTAGIHGAKIKAIGVGGGGGNMINHMIREGIEGIDLIVANTDAQALAASIAPYKMQLGINSTKGLGAGMKPEIGAEAANESFDALKTMLEGADLVFISAGLGGGTGTGAAPVIAQAAKEVGALTVSIVTSPFKFEGRKRQKLAKAGLEKLKVESDSIIVVPNERLLSIVEKNLGMRESFKLVDNVLSQAVGGISNVILSHGANDINLDFADVKTVMSHRGLALMGVGESNGNSAAYDAAKTAIESPLLDNLSIDGAMGILVHFHIHPDYPLAEISEAMDIVEENADEDANIIFGTTTSEDIPLDQVKLTIIATGFEDPSEFETLTEEEKVATSENNIKTIRQPIQGSLLNSMNSAKVVGGYNSSHDDYLDTPTFLRKQMD
jgi:cell division protein FtsZ